MSTTELNLRRAVIQLQDGQTKSLDIDAGSAQALKAYAEKFARSRKIGIDVTIDGSKMIIERTGTLVSTQRYGEMDALAIGESHLFKVSIAEHASLRRMASYRNRDGSGRFFSCSVEPDGMRVTRMPMTESERQAAPVIAEPRRASKYGLERLADVSEIRFELPKKDHQKLRIAVHQFSVKTSWTIRCRLQDDGSMLVKRMPAPQAAGDAS